VKKPIDYKAITVAVGILVALVIAATLWIRHPGESSLSRFPSSKPQAAMPSFKKIINTTLEAFTETEMAK
jgi:hypothetical protein